MPEFLAFSLFVNPAEHSVVCFFEFKLKFQAKEDSTMSRVGDAAVLLLPCFCGSDDGGDGG